jgi:TonB-linked SusC/RagA family outer membrane protein
MQLTAILLLGACLQVAAKGNAQNVTLTEKNAPIEKVLLSIEKQTNISFYYKVELLQKARPVTISVKNIPLKEALDICFKDQPLTYEQIGHIVVVKAKSFTAPPIIGIAPREGDLAPFFDVRGRVIISATEPVHGATVAVKGTKTVAMTDRNGDFSLKNIEPNAVLVISSIGIETIEAPVNNRSMMVVIAKKKVSDLDQIQIVAYGTTSKRLNTGNVTTVTSEEIMKNPVTNVLQVLQFRVPGMFVQQQTGIPGGRFNVEIRGQNTFGGQAPLYIVDGVPYPAGTPLPFVNPFITSNGDSKGLQGGNALNFIDMSQIESVDVLKDADATSIYGSRGAYGVVIITTKKGRANASGPQLTINVNQSISVRGTAPETLNTEEYLMLRKEAMANDKMTAGPAEYDVNGTWPADRYTNWTKEFSGLYSPAFTSNIAYSGGTGNTSFLIRGNYNDSKTTQKDKGSYKNMGVGFDISSATNNKKISAGLSGSFSSTINDMKPWDFSIGPLLTKAPNAPALFLPDGSLNWETGDNEAKGLNLIFKRVENNLLGNLRMEYRPLRDLSVVATLGYNMVTGKELRAEPTTFFNPSGSPSPASQSNSTLLNFTVRTISADPNISWTPRVGSRGELTLQGGATLQDILRNTTSIKGVNFIADAMLYNPAFASQANIISSYTQSPDRYAGFFGLARYDWAHKYVLKITGRYDGSTKFGSGKQWGLFGSVGAIWIFSEEKWFKDNLRFISFGKLRASYGTSGGDKIENYQFINRYSGIGSTYQGRIGLRPSTLANPNLQWEDKRSEEVGLDLGFLQDRFIIAASYYRSRTTDQLVNQPLSTVTGFGAYMVNTPALLQNSGLELSLTLNNIRQQHFTWSTYVVATVPRSKLVRYPGFDQLFNVNYRLGESINGVLLYKYAGVNPETGNYNFYKNGVKGEYLPIFSPVQLDYNKDRTEFLDLNPKYYGSITNNFQYKNLSLGFMVAIMNRMGFNFLGQQLVIAGFQNMNTTKISLNRWQKPGDITEVPRATAGINAFLLQNNFRNSTGAYSSATYARLSNVNFRYSFPEAFLKKVRVKALALTLQGQNLLTISKYKDLDPENLGAGTAPYRTYQAGISCTL